MVINFKDVRLLVFAAQRVTDAMNGNRPIDHDDAFDVIDAARQCAPILGDEARMLLCDLEDAIDKVKNEYASKIVVALYESKRAEAPTSLEQALRASVEANEATKRGVATFSQTIVEGAIAEYTKEKAPLLPRVSPSDVVVPLNGKAAP